MSQMKMAGTGQDLQRLAEEWANAERKGNTAFMKRTLTDDFTAIGPCGFVLTKDEWLQRYASGSLKYEYLEFDDVKVRTYGDAAVMTGRERQKVIYEGQPIEGDLRTTLVWVRQGGDWLLASAQMSPILGRPPGQ